MRRNARPGWVEETGNGAEVRAEGAEFVGAVELGAPANALVIDLVARLLPKPRRAAVRDRLIERLQILERRRRPCPPSSSDARRAA